MLADADVTKWDEVQQLPIEQFYTKLVLEMDKVKDQKIKQHLR